MSEISDSCFEDVLHTFPTASIQTEFCFFVSAPYPQFFQDDKGRDLTRDLFSPLPGRLPRTAGYNLHQTRFFMTAGNDPLHSRHPLKFQHPAAMRRYDVHDAMREKYDRCPDTALRSARSHATKRGSPLQNGLPRTYRATAAISSRSTHRR